jgi:hypothetical protein
VHCPDEYNRIEIDDASTGERLTRGDRKPADFFHSRLAGSPGGKRLLSAGWVWHPFDAVALFDIASSLEDPRRLDSNEGVPYGPIGAAVEEASAAFIDDDRLMIAGSDDTENEEDTPGTTLGRRGLAVVDLESRKCISSVQLSEAAGTIMPLGPSLVVSLFREPKLIEVARTSQDISRT